MKQDAFFAQYADAPDLQAYANKPVQNFGLSLLQSMGFTPQRGIGHNKKNALSEPLVLKPRPRGLGLGAEQENEEKKPKFEVGAAVVITKPPHDGLVGVVVEVREQELLVELAKSSSIVRVGLDDVKAISKEQRKQLQRGEEDGERKKKRLKWVVPNIRVKIIDKKSKHYLKKAVITEVLSEKEFECLLVEQGGQKVFIKTLREKDLQTVVPKKGGEVVVVKGSHIGERAKVVELNRQSQKVVVQTDAELEFTTVHEDDIAEYVEL